MAPIAVDKLLKKAADDEAKALELVSVEKQVDLNFDLAHLAAFDTNPINLKSFRSNKEEYIRSLTRDNTQLVVNKIWDLETKRLDNVVMAMLPKATYNLPRAKPVPKPKAPTKWEQYAAAKGIQKRKKEKLIWDEVSKEWKPRYGYHGINQNKDKWLIEVPDNADENVDYFAKENDEKKERVAKNELQRLRNIARNKKMKLPGTAGILPNIDLGKDQLNKAKSLAKQSTASLGKFTEMLPDEKPERGLGKKRKFESNLDGLKEEKNKNLEIINQMLAKQKKPIDDSMEENALKAANKMKKLKQKVNKRVKNRGDADDEDIGARFDKKNIRKIGGRKASSTGGKKFNSAKGGGNSSKFSGTKKRR